jgi:hypothetical protein
MSRNLGDDPPERIKLRQSMKRLKNLQITLPDVPPPVVDGYVAAFVPFVRTGNLIHLSGRLAKKNGKLWCGKLGEEMRSRWLWRHLYRRVNSNCEMHTKKEQSGYLSCSV